MDSVSGDRKSSLLETRKKKKKNNKRKDVSNNATREARLHDEAKNKVIEDPRFASVHSDPRFQKVPKRKTKVAIDSRFNRMFTDKNFGSSSATSLDKRGKRKKRKLDSSLRHYYQLDDRTDYNEKVENGGELFEESNYPESTCGWSDELNEDVDGAKHNDNVDGGESNEDVDGSEMNEDVDGNESEEDVDSSESTTEDEDVTFEDDMPEVEEELVPVVEEGTRRLAVVDMDWRHVRAVDLLVLLRSCLPKSGDILSVSIYPSEFGLQQLNEEERLGPVGLFDDETGKNLSDRDEEIDYEKLRAYEKKRLRYYYAVVECDSVPTADHIYKFCDGTELERSSNLLDLRYIPDSMEFKHAPRDVATEVPSSYEGLDFHTKALQHSNIPISWDEDEPQRVKMLRRHFKNDELADLDLTEFLASEGSDTDEENNFDDCSTQRKVKVDKYRSLIQSGDASEASGDEKFQDMEVTFNPGLEDLSKHILEKKNKKSESVWEEYLRKRREKRKASKRKSKGSSDDEFSDDDDGRPLKESDDFFSEELSFGKKENNNAHNSRKEKSSQHVHDDGAASREELEPLIADDNGKDNGAKGYKIKLKKGKEKKGREIDGDKIPSLNYEDPRFSKLFTSPLFALDPTDPQFKRSATYARQMAQKQRKDESKELPPNYDSNHFDNDEQTHPDPVASIKDKHQLSSLVRSIKKKSQLLSVPSMDIRKSKKH